MPSFVSPNRPVGEIENCFSMDYLGAREKFRSAVLNLKGALHSYPNPSAFGPGGEVLTVDVGIIGPTNAENVLLLISGTHGLEGPCGSAAQIGWMLNDAASELPDNTAVLLIHAINPWGYAHGFRTTENNVDLNRNFVDFNQSLPANERYAELHTARTPQDWTEQTVSEIDRALDSFAEEHGESTLFDTIARGQYTHPDGINYGGDRREWSNLVLQAIVETHLERARRIGTIDWHTGLGDYGEPFFLCFNEEGSDLFDRAAVWWTKERIRDQKPLGLERPIYTGLVFYGVQKFLGNRPLCGAVIEFGTRGPGMRKILHLDRWLKFEGMEGSEKYALLHADLCDSFVPYDTDWRQKVLNESVRITQQAVDGIGSWR